ncbi:MAG: hypothetical protein IJ512_07285 [Ruminococcus sp.]|nr:hypothetical protein [Ruminococcus sp.]
MIQLTARGKFIDTASIRHLLTQGEKFVDCIRIVVDAVNNEVDVSGCTFVMRTVASDGSMMETLLQKTVQDTQVSLLWMIPAETTAVAGMLCPELIGSKEDTNIIKYKMPPIFVKEAVMGSGLPVPDVLDEKLALMNAILEDVTEIAENVDVSTGTIQEVIDARTGVFSDYTYASLSQRLAAELGACVRQNTLETSLSNLTTTLTEEMVGRFVRSDIGDIRGEIFNDYEHNSAPGSWSTARGFSTHAHGDFSFASGYTVWAEGNGAFAHGEVIYATAPLAFAAGSHLHADATCQVVFGKYNKSDSTKALIFGNGTANDSGSGVHNASNAMTLTWDGVLWTAMDMTVPARDGGTASLRDMQDAIGMRRKNLLNVTASTTTKNGITFTVNDDRSIKVSGTATADATLDLGTLDLTLGEQYTLTGCPSGGSESTYRLYGLNTTSWAGAGSDTGSGVTFTAQYYANTVYRIVVYSGQTVNATFYPMLRYADVTDDTYAPYADDLQTQINALKAAIEALGGTV